MRICGIVSEYNPLHSGHIYHFTEVRRQLGEDCAIVCCMSGSFVQRGEGALLPKHLRAKLAVSCGADLVLENPVPYALSSAEGFAQNGVRILHGLGVLTHLSFGAEDADADWLRETASILLEHTTVAETLAQLKTGISYAAARERALFSRMQQRAALVQKPNNILAVEYCKAVQRQNIHVDILPIARKGAAHDGAELGEHASASQLRSLIRAGKASDALPYLPAPCADTLSQAMQDGTALCSFERLESAMLSHLLRLSPEELSRLPDASEGLEHRLYHAIQAGGTPEEIAMAAKTRRYALSRIRRMLLCAYLGITAQDAAIPAPYIRVLAMNEKGQEVLRLARKQATLPILTKPAHIERLPQEAQRIFALEARACDLYHLALPGWHSFTPGADWRQDAVRVGEES